MWQARALALPRICCEAVSGSSCGGLVILHGSTSRRMGENKAAAWMPQAFSLWNHQIVSGALDAMMLAVSWRLFLNVYG